jgi:hypothetical protein
MRQALRPALLFLALTQALAAQTFVVDRGGAGQFTDLPQAIAAVPSGSILRVRPGTYSAFTVQNKTLSILGDDERVLVDLAGGDITLGPLAASGRIVLHNVRGAAQLATVGRLVLQNAAGQLVLDHVGFTAAAPPLLGAPPRVVVTGCANVHFHACTFGAVQMQDTSGNAKCEIQGSRVEIESTTIMGEPAGGSGFGSAPGNPGLSAANSAVFLYGTTVVGGPGLAAGNCGLPGIGPTAGGTGCVLTAGSTLELVGGALHGGTGGDGITCRPAGAAGGAGARVTASSLRRVGGSLAGGAGGATGGAEGPATVIGAGGSIVAIVAPALMTSLRGAPAVGQTVRCSLRADAGDLAVLLLGFEQSVTSFPLFSVGALQVIPALSSNAYTVPAGGVLDVPLTIPPVWPIDRWISFQFVAAPPTLSALWAANSSGILVES